MSRFAITMRTLLLVLIFIAPTHGICTPQSNAQPNASQSAKPVKADGIIDRVLVTGAEPVFRASGYTFRILPTTEIRFGRGLQALSEVGTSTWATFEGKPDSSGAIVATKAAFARLKLPKSIPAGQVTTFPPDSKVDGDHGFAAGPGVFPQQDHGGWCGWYDVTRNPEDQEHIRRLGMKLLPQYQRDLPADDPARIPFRFYVIEEKEIRSAIFCPNGLVLLPVEAVTRLHNDDQLAAVLADGIAGELQLQANDGRPYTWKDGAELAAGGLGIAGPIPAAVGGAGGLVALHNAGRTLEHERARMALAFTADAGFDPRQAPEAWRLLAPGHLPKDQTKLKAPERSLYLQNILDAQSNGAPENTAPGADHSAAPGSGNGAPIHD
jgi:hypothetical protein